MPIDFGSSYDNIEKLGYYPSYNFLNPQQRYVYLTWLCDITKPVDIGYVFIFYYGLERHLISGNYTDAVNTILTLRQYHKHPSFMSYSANALIMSAILHKDKDTLIKVSGLIGETSYCSNIVLIGKFLQRLDLTSDEIITLGSAVGFTNKRYIKDYPELFKKSLESILMNELGQKSFPIYELKMQYPSQPIMSFANISLEEDVRSPVVPDLIHSPEFSSAINKLLTMAHDEVKQSLAEMRKSGSAPEPKSTEIHGAGPKPECPYCHNFLDKMPGAKKKCPHCKKDIIVRTDPIEKKKILLREDQIDEFNERLQQIRCHKTIKKYLHGIDATQLDQIKENIKMRIGKEPTEKDVALEILDNQGYHHFKNFDMGLFRNTILYKSDIFKASGDLRNALIMYLELCYIDSNGPRNHGSIKNDPEMLKEHPPFTPEEHGLAILAPGIIKYITKINKDLNLSKEEIKQIFLSII